MNNKYSVMNNKELMWFIDELVGDTNFRRKFDAQHSLMDSFQDYLDQGYRMSSEEIDRVVTQISKIEE